MSHSSGNPSLTQHNSELQLDGYCGASNRAMQGMQSVNAFVVEALHV
jgi:hypothetical protein